MALCNENSHELARRSHVDARMLARFRSRIGPAARVRGAGQEPRRETIPFTVETPDNKYNAGSV